MQGAVGAQLAPLYSVPVVSASMGRSWRCTSMQSAPDQDRIRLVAELLVRVTHRSGFEFSGEFLSQVFSQAVKYLRRDLRQGGAVSRRPDSDASRLLIRCARVSTRGQDLDQQRAALSAAGCIRIFEEKASGANCDRPELARMLDHLRAGDVVTITRRERLARSMADLLAIAVRINEVDANLRSLGRAMGRHGHAGLAHGTAFKRLRCQ